jgi:hypothetical protein
MSESVFKINPERGISTDDGIAVAQDLDKQARREGVRAAVCGGLALHFYGFTRATKDVDFVAANTLALPSVRPLAFGGECYLVKLREQEIPIDWIVRDDDYQELYQAALSDAVPTDKGFLLVTPEWMVILKMFAGRGKDEIDLLWLLRADELVDRQQVIALLRQHLGRAAAFPAQEMEGYFLQADLMRARDERG